MYLICLGEAFFSQHGLQAHLKSAVWPILLFLKLLIIILYHNLHVRNCSKSVKSKLHQCGALNSAPPAPEA